MYGSRAMQYTAHIHGNIPLTVYFSLRRRRFTVTPPYELTNTLRNVVSSQEVKCDGSDMPVRVIPFARTIIPVYLLFRAYTSYLCQSVSFASGNVVKKQRYLAESNIIIMQITNIFVKNIFILIKK